DLAGTDIAEYALAALRTSKVREVVIAARRGPAESAFTLPELIGLTSTADVVLDAGDHELVQQATATATDPLIRAKLEILAKLGDADAPAARPRIRLAYRLTPTRVGEFTRTGTEDTVALDAGLVLTSIGYRGKPIRDLPFDEVAAVVPNDGGRVTPGTYVAGWIKRGPTGFIGTNKSCALETVQGLVADYNDGRLADPAAGSGALAKLVRLRQPEVVDAAGWAAINAAESGRGTKFTTVSDMLAAAANRPKPTVRQRLLAGLRG
ncbi:MAG: ferredoxin, partial [Mycobacterium sp.]